MKTTLESQIEPLKAEWTKLFSSLIPLIVDDYRATNDPDDNEPGVCVTIGFTPADDDRDASWSYQTGDNSFSGGAYKHPHWAVVYLSRDSVPAELADDVVSQFAELCD